MAKRAKRATRAEKLAMSKEQGLSKDQVANKIKTQNIENQKQEPDPFEKVWDVPCLVCDQVPTVRATELCGPCTFGEAETVGGNW